MKRILNALIFISLFFCFAPSAFSSVEQIRVLTLNTWMIPLKRKMAKARAEAIGRELENFDIALMQEAFTPGIRKTIASLAKKSVFDNRFQTSPFFKLNAGLFSFTKYKIVKSKFLRFFSCGGIQCVSSKGVLYLQVLLPNGQLLDLFNTHLQAYEEDHKVRKRQLARAMKFINRINDGTVPAIFAGDFNIIAETEEYDFLMNSLVGYKDVWKEINPREPGFTWDPSLNYWAEYDHQESQLLQRLDYIFIKNGTTAHWKIKNANLAFNEEKLWFGVYKVARKTFVSDHFGVETTLQLVTK